MCQYVLHTSTLSSELIKVCFISYLFVIRHTDHMFRVLKSCVIGSSYSGIKGKIHIKALIMNASLCGLRGVLGRGEL